jgi:hypothetical protein
VSISRRDLARSPLTSHENDEQFPSFTRFSIGPQEKTFFFKNNFKLIFCLLAAHLCAFIVYRLLLSSFVTCYIQGICIARATTTTTTTTFRRTRRRENSFLLLLFCLQQPQVRTQVLQVSPTGTNQQIELKYHKLMQIV